MYIFICNPLEVLVMNIVKFFAIQICAFAAIFAFWQAYEWINSGYGLNPFVAIPAGCVLIGFPYILELIERS